MKYIKYKLLADWTQPYVTLSQYDVSFEWWVITDYTYYIWYMEWTQMDEWIQACSAFSMIEITAQQAIDFFDSLLPETTIDMDWNIFTIWNAYVWLDWKITYDITPV